MPLEYLGFNRVDHHPESRRWLCVCEWVVVAFLTAHLGASAVPKAWRTLNTDFPNYYLTARLLHDHYDMSRVYEWIWLQRQKDHRDIDQRTVGMVPITPFSTLIVYPLTSMPALPAKRCWLFLNLGLLFMNLYFLRALTQLPWRRLALVATLSFPLTVNFLFGQYYVLLLFLLTLSCWFYIRQQRFLAGVVAGLAAGLKIFPIIFVLYFLRKRDLRAFAGGLIGSLCSVIVSVFAFGWELNRTYIAQILPAVLRGEGLDPYNLQAASLSSLLHRLFVYEPQLNPHPAVDAAWLVAVFHPLLQIAIMAPALLLAVPHETSPDRIHLEWAAIILASIAISTSPASYLLTLLIFPVCVMLAALKAKRSGPWAAILLLLYATAGILRGTNHEGWHALLGVPRVYALIALCLFAYSLLIRQQQPEAVSLDHCCWAAAFCVILTINMASGLRHQQGLYSDYQWRISAPRDILLAADPVVQDDAVLFVALLSDGYHSAVNRLGAVQFDSTSHDDSLSVTSAKSKSWVEQAGHESRIAAVHDGSGVIQPAESPVLSIDGRWLAFLREDRGRGRIWLHDLDQPGRADKPLTPPGANVLEMSFMPGGRLVFSAASDGQPSLFTTDQIGNIQSLGTDDARYPAVSPDGQWLAYSQLQRGNWNLWLRDLNNGKARRLTHASCNDLEPAWTADSLTLIYASDCGRGLWFTALCRRRIFP